MTYFGVLGTFVIPPTLVLMILVPRDLWGWLIRRQGKVNWEPYLIVLIHVLVALVYTTPWDNYLVATGVWWYDPDLVTGLTLGWVPIEEYTFFVVQTLLTGLWTLTLMRLSMEGARSDDSPPVQFDTGSSYGRLKSLPQTVNPRTGTRCRLVAAALVFSLWLISTLLLLLGPASGSYLALILSWALIPVLMQVAFGADILLANWQLLMVAILPPTFYLWLVDAIAMASGTWTIDPVQTTGIKLGSLPMEEMLFFLVTNLIIAFGITLMLSKASKERARVTATWLKQGLTKRSHRFGKGLGFGPLNDNVRN